MSTKSVGDLHVLKELKMRSWSKGGRKVGMREVIREKNSCSGSKCIQEWNGQVFGSRHSS